MSQDLRTPISEKRYLNDLEAASYIGCCRSTARKISALAGARRKIGGRVFNDRVSIDEYISSQGG